MRGLPGYLTRLSAAGVGTRPAVTMFAVFVLLLNILTGTLSHAHYGDDGISIPSGGSKMAICSGTQMVYIDKDGNATPVPHQQGQLECACCLLMQASAVMPPPSAAPSPLQLAAIQILRPAGAELARAAAVRTFGNRDPPSQA
jgi:hypothetical protein